MSTSPEDGSREDHSREDHSREDNSGGGQEPPAFGPGLRLPLYLLVALLTLDLGTWILAGLLGFDLISAEGEAGRLEFAPLLLLQALVLPILALVTWRFLAVFDPRPLGDFGLGWPRGERRAARGQALGVLLAVGFGLGLWLGLAAFLAEVRFGGLSDVFRQGPGWLPGPVGSVLFLALHLGGFLLAAALDEWIFRGYLYTGLRERFSWVNAAGMSAVFPVLLLLPAPGVEAPALVNTFLFGLLFAALREGTGSLWAPVLFHGLWNFFLGCIFSLPVSGLTGFRLLALEVEGEAVWTGGEWGPEGTWTMAGVLLLALLAVASRFEPELPGETQAPSENESSDENL